MALEWKDVTSRSRGESRDGEARTVEARLSWARVVVTRHIHYPGWLLLCDGVGLGSHQQLKATALEDAKSEALGIVRERVGQLAKALETCD